MSDARMNGEPERPRFEPEIIPPERGDARSGAGQDDVFVYVDSRGGTRRVHIGRPSPFSIILAFLIGGLILAGILFVAFSAVVVLVPVIAVAVAGLVAYAYLRGAWRRLRSN
jgi:hypothetical protein